jgi:hypothetical protein
MELLQQSLKSKFRAWLIASKRFIRLFLLLVVGLLKDEIRRKKAACVAWLAV